MRALLTCETITRSIIGAFFEVYNTLGFGFLEIFYSKALEKELVARGHTVDREAVVSVSYKGDVLGQQRLDMVVDNKVIIEIKATDTLNKDAHRQLLSYLRATDFEVGLLLHFSPSTAKFFRFVSSNDPRKFAQSAKSAQL